MGLTSGSLSACAPSPEQAEGKAPWSSLSLAQAAGPGHSEPWIRLCDSLQLPSSPNITLNGLWKKGFSSRQLQGAKVAIPGKGQEKTTYWDMRGRV